jgi:hypothetical protein
MIEGEIYKVKSSFVSKFMDSLIDKRPNLNNNDIVEKLGDLSGRWPV